MTRSDLKDIPNRNDDSTVATIRSQLIQETSVGYGGVRNTEVTSVGEIIEVRSKLKSLILSDVRILQDSDVDIVDTVSAEDIAPRSSDALSGPQRLEERITIS